jgi:oxygen-independent coproporphyrinogen-3 oxidase
MVSDFQPESPRVFAPIQFDPVLVRRYDVQGPRYTSYPPANHLHAGFGVDDYRAAARASNGDPIPRPLSLYFHIPFCDTVCYYCACNKVVTRDHARGGDYLGHLIRELAMHAELYDADRIVEQIHLGGGTPTFLSDEQLAELMRAVQAHFPVRGDNAGEFSIEVDPRTVDAGRVRHLRAIGFNRMSVGVQDVDPAVQQAIHRIQPYEQTAAVIAAARGAGFRSINVDLMYGLPRQTLKSYDATLDRIIALRPDRLAVYNYAHLPERFKPQRRIAVAELPPPEEKLAMLERIIARLTDAGYVYIGMDHFALPEDELAVALRTGGLHRNFQGYSTRAECDLVGIGASAIGSVADCLVQNERDVEAYSLVVGGGRLPVARGFQLSADDMLRREVIGDLMCRFRVPFARVTARWHVIFQQYFEAEMRDLRRFADDGLVEISDEAIEVTNAGRLLVRNICMVFDRYLRAGAGQPAYSRVI